MGVLMNVSFPLMHQNTHTNKTTGVWGEEIVADACVKMLSKAGINSYTSNIRKLEENAPFTSLSRIHVAIYMSHETVSPWRLKRISDKSILWIQGFSYDSNMNIIPLDEIYNCFKEHYDLVITSSRVLAEKYDIPFVVPPLDTEKYYPVKTAKHTDCSFIGNIIKPFDTNKRYLRPFKDFKYQILGGDMGKISHDKWLKVVCGSKINLHYGFKEGIKWDMVTGRPLFVSACKSFLMCDKIPYFMEKFKEAFVFTDGGEDEVEKIKYYLENEEEREKKSLLAYEILRDMQFNKLTEVLEGVI